jgi:lipopolysaccharide heptosyltransferase II
MGYYRYTRWRWHIVFAAIDLLGWCLFGPMRLVQAWRRRRSPPREPRSILVVQLDHLGDAVMSLGLIRALRRRYPATNLTVLCGEAARELFLARPEVNAVSCMRATRFSRRGGRRWIINLVSWGWRLRRRKFDLAIDVRGEFPHALLLWLSGARRRLGWASGGGGFLLTDRLRHVPGRHEVLSRAALLAALGVRDDDFAPPKLERPPRGEKHQPLVVLHVGAGMPAKRWPARHWQELAGRLIVEFNAQIVLVGGVEDGALAQQIIANEFCGQRGSLPIGNCVGKLTLTQLSNVLRRADLFIGADSGPAHLAAAVGAPVVALFSSTNDPAQWRPWGAKVVVVRHAPACSPCHLEVCPFVDHPCMHGLSPEAVMHEVRKLLAPRFVTHSVSHARFMEGDPHGFANRPAIAPLENKILA